MFFVASRRRLLHVNIIRLGPRPNTYLFRWYTSLPYTPHAWLSRLFISVVAVSRAVFLAGNLWVDVHSMNLAFRDEVNQVQLDVATVMAALVVTLMLPSKARERHEAESYYIQASYYPRRISLWLSILFRRHSPDPRRYSSALRRHCKSALPAHRAAVEADNQLKATTLRVTNDCITERQIAARHERQLSICLTL